MSTRSRAGLATPASSTESQNFDFQIWGALLIYWSTMGGTPVRILLARHGETVFNVEGRWQGQADSPLTERGRAQAAELARALGGEQIAAVYSSDLGRAADTAAEVATLHQLGVTQEPMLREIDVGA